MAIPVWCILVLLLIRIIILEKGLSGIVRELKRSNEVKDKGEV